MKDVKECEERNLNKHLNRNPHNLSEARKHDGCIEEETLLTLQSHL